MWTEVKDYTEIPPGVWFVQLETDRERDVQVAYVRPNMTIIGGVFGFDESRVMAYHPIPEKFKK